MLLAGLHRRTGESFTDRYFLAVLVEILEYLNNCLIRIAVRVVVHLSSNDCSDSDRERQLLLLRLLGRLSVALHELERVLREELFA